MGSFDHIGVTLTCSKEQNHFNTWQAIVVCVFVCLELGISSVQLLSRVWLWYPMDCSTPGFPVPSPTPRACWNSCPLSWWYHLIISSSVVHFSSYVQSFEASGSCPVSQFFAWGGQSIGVSASASVLPMNIQDQFPLGLTGLISLLSRVFSRFRNITSSVLSSQFMVQLSHLYMTTEIYPRYKM